MAHASVFTVPDHTAMAWDTALTLRGDGFGTAISLTGPGCAPSPVFLELPATPAASHHMNTITTSGCESERTWLPSADPVDKTVTCRSLGHSVITLAKSECGESNTGSPAPKAGALPLRDIPLVRDRL